MNEYNYTHLCNVALRLGSKVSISTQPGKIKTKD